MERCPKCRSTDVEYQVVQETKTATHTTKTKTEIKEKSHGILWWLFWGIWRELFLWLVFFPIKLIYELIRKRNYEANSTGKTVTKNKTTYQTVCLCKNCGHNWKK